MRTPLPLRHLLLIAVFSLGVAAAAAAGPLSGHVQAGGAPLEGATVNAIDRAKEEVVGSALTDGAGFYTIELADGIYDIQVLPPPDSNLNGTTRLGFVVAGPTTLDFALAGPTAATFSGTLLDRAGIGVPSQTVQLIRAGGEVGDTTVTDANGDFSFNAQTGSHFLLVSGDNQGSSRQAPQSYIIQTGPFEITGDTDLTYTLPVKVVNVHVQTQNGSDLDPVANAGLSTTNALNCGLQFGPFAACGISSYDFNPLAPPNTNAITDGSGNVTLYLFPTPSTLEFLYSLTATPDVPDLAPGTVSDVIISADVTPITITLVAPTILSGELQDGVGTGIASQTLVLRPDGQEDGFPTTTNEFGVYSFAVQPGSYRLDAFGDNQGFERAAPQAYSINSGPFTVGASQVTNFQLPVRRVEVHVKTAANVPVAGVGISTTSVSSCELAFGPGPAPACGFSGYNFLGSPGEPVTDSSGNITMWLFPTPAVPDPSIEGTYRFTAFPPSGSGQAPTTVSNIHVTTDPTIVTITLAAPVSFSGRLFDANGAGIPNQFLELMPEAVGPSVSTQTGADGSYSFGVQAGTYRLTVIGDNQDFGYAAPQFYAFQTAPFTISGSQVANLTVPVNTVDVHVQDTANADVPNVGFTAFGPTSCGLLPFEGLGPFSTITACGNSQYFYVQPPAGSPPPPTGVTSATGDLSLYLFRTPTPAPGEDPVGYGITASPLADSGYENATVIDVAVVVNFDLIIVLPALHLAPVTTLTITPSPDGNGRYPDPATITLTAVAAPGFAIDNTFYEVDGGGLQAYAGPFDIGGPGPHTVTYYSVDSGNLAETPQTFNFEIAFPDPDPPTTTATPSPAPNAAGWNKADVTVTLNAVDNPGGSGVEKITYSISGAQATAATDVPGDTASIVITTEGISVITFFATDVAGNVEAAQTLTVRLDKTAPEVYSRWDPATRDILFFGRDAGSGVPAAPVTPTVAFGLFGFELRIYEVQDAAGHTLRATVSAVRLFRQIDASILALTYNDGAPTLPPGNAQSFKWKLNPNGSLKELDQSVLAVPALVHAEFKSTTNQTTITRLFPLPISQVTQPGLVLLRLATSQGALAIEY